MKKLLLLCLLSLAPQIFGANLVEMIKENPDLSTLYSLVEKAGLADALSKGTYTIIAPTNEAFAKIPADSVKALVNNIDQLKSVLLGHVVKGNYTSDLISKINSAPTLAGNSIAINADRGGVKLNNASNVTRADIKASNGVIHLVDTVILP